MGFWKTYWGFTPFVRVCLAVSLVLGVSLLVLCLWGDSTHPPWFWPSWWHRLGYGLNIFASFTAFLIGVPIALVVLDTIKSDAAQKQQIESVNRISKVAWSDFSKAVHDLCTDERINATKMADDKSSATDQVQAEHDLILEKIEACRNAIRAVPKQNPSRIAHAADLKSFLAIHATTFEQRRKAVDEQCGSEYTLRPKWNYTLSLWQVLDTHVRLRRMEFELEPMAQDSYRNILDKMTSTRNDMFGFLEAHNGKSSHEEGFTSMLSLQSIMESFLSLSEQQIIVILDEHYSEHIGIGLDTYWMRAWQASTFLSLLRISVNAVTKSGWPGKATKPKSEKEIDAKP